MTDSKWKAYPEKKPENDMICYITNKKFGSYCFICSYNKNYDFFKLYDPSLYNQPPVEVTHWVELPEPYEAE